MSDDITEVEFRDGTRWVPSYLVALFRLSGLETHTMTFQQAVDRANGGLLRWRLDDAQSTTIAQHFKKEPWER